MTEHIDAPTLAMFHEALLPPDESEGVRAHLAGCARCRQTESQLTVVSELLASGSVPPMPAALTARIENALAAEAAARDATAPASTAPASTAQASTAPASSAQASTAPASSAQAAPAAGAPSTRSAPGQPGDAHPGSEAPAAAAAAPVGADGPQPRSDPARPAQPVPAGAGTGPGRAGGAGRPAGHPASRRARGAPSRGRSRLRALAVAAAVAVIGGGGYAVAQLTAQGGLPAAGVPAARPSVHTAGPVLQGPNRPPAAQTATSTVTSGTDYRPGQFASQVRTVLARYPAGGPRRAVPGDQALPGGGLAGCVHAVTGGQPARLIDVARYDGRPAMVIMVAASAAGPARAWAVGRDCSATRPDVLARVSVPAGG